MSTRILPIRYPALRLALPLLHATLLASLLAGWLAAEAVAADCGFTLEESGDSRIRVIFRLPAWELVPVAAGQRDQLRLETACGEWMPGAGATPSPCYQTMLALPPGGRVSLRWNAGPSRTLEGLRFPQAPPDTAAALEMVQLLGPDRLRDFTVVRLLLHPFAYDPAAGTLTVTETIEVTLELAPESRLAPSPAGASRPEPAFEPLYRERLLNYESAARWRMLRERGPRLAAGFSGSGRWVSLRLGQSDLYQLTGERLAAAGVPLEQVDPERLRLFWGGGEQLPEDQAAPRPELREVALLVEGAGDGSFDPQDRLVFFGQGLDRFTADDSGRVASLRHRYDNRAAYWLSWEGDQPGLRMEQPPAAPVSGAPAANAEFWTHFEENTTYLASTDPNTLDAWNPAPDYWGWGEEADAGGAAERRLALPFAPAGATGHRLRFELYSTRFRQLTSYRVRLNGQQLAASNILPLPVGRATSGWLELPAGLLLPENQFRVEGEGLAPGFIELRWRAPLRLPAGGRLIFHESGGPAAPSFAFSEVGAERAALFDLSRPEEPRYLGERTVQGGRLEFAAPESALPVRSFGAVADGAYREPEEVRLAELPGLRSFLGAEYLVLAPRMLLPQAQRLAALHASRYSTAVVEVEDIYDEFSFGISDPVAIRDFLQHAFLNWSIRPQLVLLFGDGHVDYRGYTAAGRSRPSLIPPYVTINDLAVEEWFVRLDGSALPQLALGRLPVQDAAEAEAVLAKLEGYLQGREAGDWSRRTILAADDGLNLGGACDEVTNHVPASEFIDSLLPAQFERRKVYLDRYPLDPPEIGTRKPAATGDLLDWWNRGALLVNFIGHGSPLYWAQERLFDVERDLQALRNGYRLPLVLNLSCSIGHFDDYTVQAMAERLLIHPGGGAIAVYAGTRVTYAFQNQALNRLLVQNLFGGADQPLGLAVLAARLGLGTQDFGNAQRYSLFGDPALRLHRPEGAVALAAEEPGSLQGGRKVRFGGTVRRGDGTPDAGFSGVAGIKFLGGAGMVNLAYQCREGGRLQQRTASFNATAPVLFDGTVTVSAGSFSGAFILPVNLGGSLPEDTAGGSQGRFLAYATSDRGDAAGASAPVTVSHAAAALNDSLPPSISLLAGERELEDGERVIRNQELRLVLNDESGINTTGEPGVQLTLEVDDGLGLADDLTPLFRYDTDSYSRGSVAVDLTRVEPGLHSLRFRATDNALNTGRLELMLNVEAEGAGLALSQVVNYPNPFRDETEICFELSAPADVRVRIFSVAGRPVRELSAYGLPAGFHRLRWDGTDEYQEKVANGVYLYKIICSSTAVGSSQGKQEVEAIGKALLSR